MTEGGRRELPTAWRDQLERPISREEVQFASRKGAKNKAPGIDGIGLEFYKTNWATIKYDISAMMKHMFTERTVHVTKARTDRVSVQVERKNSTGRLSAQHPIEHRL